ncbi:TPA: LPXTG cell wall anchor domain-containing protein [Streptococcus suis]|nr:LPXTG cell wall anchor domain-containing protein [Streptococcus suis]HEM5214734.1 LPXTG cell wall anchor domain-containing protein [Streptococcus suis]
MEVFSMKIKRSSSKKQLHKWTKLGVGLAAVTVLGGGTTLAGIDLFHVDTVYAQAQESVTAVLTFYDVSDLSEIADRVYIDVKPGESISYTFPVFDGYTLHEDYDNVLVLDYDDVVRMNGRTYATGFRKVEKPAGDTNSTDTNTVNYTIQLVDQDGQVLQTIQRSGVEGTEVTFDFPVISGYRVGKAEGFESGTVGKNGSFRLVANKTVKVYYDKAPSIDSLIRPEQRVEYQKVFDTFHTTVLKAFEVYKKELGVDHIIRLTEDEAKFNQITQSEDLTTLQLELILVENLFNEPVGLVLTDQDIINAIGWTPEYWDYQIAYHKEITQKLEKAMANIAASKAIPTVPVDQSITIKAVYTEEQIEPGQKVDVLKEIEYTLKPGESVVLEPLTFEGWTSRVVQESQTVTYEEAKARPNKEYYFYYIEEGTTPTEKPIETPAETPTEKPAEQLVEKPTEQPVEKLVERPTASPTGQSASEKQATKQGDKEPAAPASQSKQSTVKPASTSQSQTKTLPATGEVSSVLHLTGLGLLGLAGLVVKRRQRKSS